MQAPRSALGGGWQPAPGDLENVVRLIKTAMDPHTSNQQKREISQEVDKLSLSAEFARYLAFVMAEAQDIGASDELRHMCSLVLLKAVVIALKNQVLSEDGLEHVKRSVLKTLVDGNKLLRRSATNLVAKMVFYSRLSSWPQLLEVLSEALTQPRDAGAFEGAFLALEHLCEDCPDQLSSAETNGLPPLATFLPFLVDCFRNPVAQHRARAVRCVNYLMEAEELPALLSMHAQDILQGLSALAQDPDQEVKRETCKAITNVLVHRVDVVTPHLASIVTFMLASIDDADESVAMEAIDFFRQLAYETTVAVEALRPHLSALFGALLRRMVYTEEELGVLGTDEENDVSVPDREEDIRPSHHAGLSARGVQEGSGGDAQDDGAEDEDDGDDDEEVGFRAYFNMWTLRKAAGSTLQELADVLPAQEALPLLLPALQADLSGAKNWLAREAAVFAMGLLSGYMAALDEHLPNLVPYLINESGSADTQVRVTAMWSLSRYADWIVEAQGSGRPGDGLLPQCVVVLTKGVMDRNKQVQHSACSQLSRLASAAGAKLEPFAEEVAGMLMQAYAMYQVNSKKAMLDLLAAFYESAPATMCKPAVLQLVLAPLWRDFSALRDSDLLTLLYMETFACMIEQAKANFGPGIKPLYDRAVYLVQGTVTLLALAPDQGLRPEDTERELMHGALSLLDCMTEALEGHMEELIDFDTFLPLMDEVLKDGDAVTVELAAALCGDLAHAVPKRFAPLMPIAVRRLQAHLYPPDLPPPSVLNCAWALGMIVPKMGPAFKDYDDNKVTNKLVMLLCSDRTEDKIKNNAAVTLGRICISCPELVVPHLSECGGPWSRSCGQIVVSPAVDGSEKHDAVMGLFHAVQANPVAAGSFFPALCNLSARLSEATPAIQQAARTVLQTVRASMQAAGTWTQTLQRVPGALMAELERLQMLQR